MNRTSALVFAVLMAGTNAIALHNLEGECLCEDNTSSPSCCPVNCAPTCGAPADHHGKPIPDVVKAKVDKKVEKKEVAKEKKDLTVKKAKPTPAEKEVVAKVVHHAAVKKAKVAEKETVDKTKAKEAHKEVKHIAEKASHDAEKAKAIHHHAAKAKEEAHHDSVHAAKKIAVADHEKAKADVAKKAAAKPHATKEVKEAAKK